MAAPSPAAPSVVPRLLTSTSDPSQDRRPPLSADRPRRRPRKGTGLVSEQERPEPWGYVPAGVRIRYDEQCRSIPHAVGLAARRHAGLEALVEGDLRLSFTQLEQRMLTSVRAMLALGVRPGDRIAVWAPNSARWILAALGILGAGGILVPVNTRFRGQEAAYVLEKSGASGLVVVTDFLDQDYLGMLRAAAPDAAVLQKGWVLVASGPAGDGEIGWDDFI